MNQYHPTQHANFTDGSAGRAGRAVKHYPAYSPPPSPKESATEFAVLRCVECVSVCVYF
jgi:hypothetical protein